MFILNSDGTYESEHTGMKFYGEGSFADEVSDSVCRSLFVPSVSFLTCSKTLNAQPDQIMHGPTRKYIYYTEDGGNHCGIHARYSDSGTYLTLFQAMNGHYDDDETIGIALSPDHRRMYAGIQDAGLIFELTRDDGSPFE